MSPSTYADWLRVLLGVFFCEMRCVVEQIKRMDFYAFRKHMYLYV